MGSSKNNVEGQSPDHVTTALVLFKRKNIKSNHKLATRIA